MIEQTDDDGLPARLPAAGRYQGRHAGLPPSGAFGHRAGAGIRFGPLSFAVGYLVAAVVLAGIATAAVGWGSSRGFWGYAWIVVIAAFYAAGLGLFTAAPIGIILGLLLRPVGNQWVHVLVFFAVPAALTWVVVGLAVGAVLVPLLMGLAVGTAAAAGRAAVWRLVTSA